MNHTQQRVVDILLNVIIVLLLLISFKMIYVSYQLMQQATERTQIMLNDWEKRGAIRILE